jgi:hypothetical protein
MEKRPIEVHQLLAEDDVCVKQEKVEELKFIQIILEPTC